MGRDVVLEKKEELTVRNSQWAFLRVGRGGGGEIKLVSKKKSKAN